MGVSQGFLVYRDGETYRAVGAVTRADWAHGPSAGKVIQAAIDAAPSEGGRVTLEQGVFDLDEPLRLKDHLHRGGQGRPTKLRMTAANAAGQAVVMEGLNCAAVSELAIQPGDCASASIGVLLHDCGDCKVQNVAVAGLAGWGIVVRENSFLCEVTGCRLAGNAEGGVLLRQLKKGRVGDYISNTVHDCLVYGGGCGIECSESTVVNLTGNTVFQNHGHAYFIHERSNSVLINGCRSFQITGSAVVVDDSHEVNITGNIFCWHTEHGIVVNDCKWGLISGNNIIDTGSYNTGKKDQTVSFIETGPLPFLDGVHMTASRGFNVSSNTIFNWPQGTQMGSAIREDSECLYNVFSGNNLNYYRDGAVISEGQHSKVGENVGLGEDPHWSSRTYKWVQSFQPHLTREFIEKQL